MKKKRKGKHEEETMQEEKTREKGRRRLGTIATRATRQDLQIRGCAKTNNKVYGEYHKGA